MLNRYEMWSGVMVGIAVAGLSDRPAFGQSFRGIGGTTATAVSADGSTVVGNNGVWGDNTARPWRWTAQRGVVFLPPLTSGGFNGLAKEVSADGSVVVGQTLTLGPNPRLDALRWDAAGRPLSLGSGNGEAVSADGSVVAGTDRNAVLWTVGTGGVAARAIMENKYVSVAFGLTPDATVAVGGGIFPDVVGGRRAFRWTEATGAESLGVLLGHTYSDAHDVSDDGRTVVGYGEGSGTGIRRAEAFRWTAETGMVGLGDLPGGVDYSFASSVSADGSLVGGYANSDAGIEYVLWDAAGNIRRLEEVLEDDFGLNLGGWQLTAQGGSLPFTSPLSLSADGRTIVGTGINPQGVREAWMAVVPEPAVVPLLMFCATGLLRRTGRRRRGVK